MHDKIIEIQQNPPGFTIALDMEWTDPLLFQMLFDGRDNRLYLNDRPTAAQRRPVPGHRRKEREVLPPDCGQQPLTLFTAWPLGARMTLVSGRGTGSAG